MALMPQVKTDEEGDRRGGKPKSFKDLVKGKEGWEFWMKRGEKKRVLRNSGRCRWEFHVKGWNLCHRLMTLPQTCVCVPFHVHADLQSCYAVLCWWQSMLNHNHDAVTVSHIYINQRMSWNWIILEHPLTALYRRTDRTWLKLINRRYMI